MNRRDETLRRVRAANPALADQELPADGRPPLGVLIGGVEERSPSSRWTARRKTLAAAAGAALVLAALVPILLLRNGASGSETATGPVPTTTVAMTTSVGVMSVESWVSVESNMLAAVEGIFDMIDTESGLVAVGYAPGTSDSRYDGVVLRSVNGLDWSRIGADEPALTDGNVITLGIAEGGPGLVIVGMGCEDDDDCRVRPTVWTSAEGEGWSRLEADSMARSGAMVDVLQTAGGLVAAGNVRDGDPGFDTPSLPAVWTSTDGASWRRVWTGEPIESVGSVYLPGIVALAAGPDGLLIGVGTADDAAGRHVAAVWVGSEGGTWDRVGGGPAVFGAGSVLLDVTWGPAGFIGVGTVNGQKAAVWRSTDGHEWDRVDLSTEPFGAAASIGIVASLDRGYVAAGPHGAGPLVTDRMAVWTSVDGADWDLVEVQRSGWAQSIAATDAITVVAGGLRTVDDHAGVWVGPALDPINPPAEPLVEIVLPPDPSSQEYLIEPGHTCEDLALAGAFYPQVVSYLMYHGIDLDLTGSGLPCEGFFSEAEIAGVFGDPTGQRLEGGEDWFLGPAVTTGAICPSGRIEGFGDNLAVEPGLAQQGGLFASISQVTCDDGSGTFIIRYTGFVDQGLVSPWPEDGDDVGSSGIWSIESGTGDYAGLSGGGAWTWWEFDWSWDEEGPTRTEADMIGLIKVR